MPDERTFEILRETNENALKMDHTGIISIETISQLNSICERSLKSYIKGAYKLLFLQGHLSS